MHADLPPGQDLGAERQLDARDAVLLELREAGRRRIVGRSSGGEQILRLDVRPRRDGLPYEPLAPQRGVSPDHARIKAEYHATRARVPTPTGGSGGPAV